MTTAAEIIETLRPLSIAACTLEYGYAVIHGGKRIMFQPCARVVSMRRDKGGRCRMMLCEYADGSRIRFTYSQSERAEYRDATPRPGTI